jgi:hypothetical protein
MACKIYFCSDFAKITLSTNASRSIVLARYYVELASSQWQFGLKATCHLPDYLPLTGWNRSEESEACQRIFGPIMCLRTRIYACRVDTSASISSLHCTEIIFENAADDPAENSGKNVRFLLEGPNGKRHWL